MNNPKSFAVAILLTLIIVVILARRPRSSHVPGIGRVHWTSQAKRDKEMRAPDLYEEWMDDPD